MKIEKIKTYLFDELTKEQQEKAIENYHDINTHENWHDYLLEEWKEKLANQGFENAEINYTGFWSQGDGASFNCIVNLPMFLKSRKIASKYAKLITNYHKGVMSIKITNGGNYCHEYMMSLDYWDDNDLESGDLEKIILDEARNQARKIYKELEEDYSGLSSNEAIEETLKINEFYFTKDGKIF